MLHLHFKQKQEGVATWYGNPFGLNTDPNAINNGLEIIYNTNKKHFLLLRHRSEDNDTENGFLLPSSVTVIGPIKRALATSNITFHVRLMI